MLMILKNKDMEVENLYTEILEAAITEIQTTRVSIARKVNEAGIGMYWNLGKLLSEKKIEKGHGAGVVKRLSTDLKLRFSDIGVSPRNLWHMKRFYERYSHADSKLQRSIAVLPWRHNLLLLEKVTNDKEALYYAEKAVSLGWTKNQHTQINCDLWCKADLRSNLNM